MMLTAGVRLMASEILAVPESSLAEVVAVIRAGLQAVEVSVETREALSNWCNESLSEEDEIDGWCKEADSDRRYANNNVRASVTVEAWRKQ
jgi:hypothetical protein